MSRPTASQIIAKGDYLEPSFDPTSLTIPQLIGVFAYHQISYPSQHNKAKLIEIFNQQVKARGATLRRQRLDRQETAASEDGIIDGVTGAPIAPQAQSSMPARRSSRRVSREPSSEVQRPDPPKRRRSSAAPTLGRASKAKAIVTPAPVSEESEPEEEPAPKTTRKFIAIKTEPESPEQSSRRVSQKFGPGTEESGWEDNNIFQSGAESSSPVRVPKAKTTRKSSTRKSRSSLSAPPEIDSSPTRTSFPANTFAPPQSRFEPVLPASVTRTRSRLAPVKYEALDHYEEENSAFADISADISKDVILEDDEEEEVHEQEDDGNDVIYEDEMTAEVSRRIANGGSDALVRRQQLRPSAPLWQRIIIALITLALSGIVGQYKLESAPIGFCERGKNTNAGLERLIQQRRNVEICHAQFDGTDSSNECPPLPLIPLPRPEACTPCPEHATCTRTQVTCDDGYILSPHPLALIPYASQIADGLPGLGPVAFPSRCVVDPLRKKSIGVLGKRIDTTLALERGRRLCAGIDTHRPVDGGEARRWGFEADQLKALMKQKLVRDGEHQPSKKTTENFDRVYGEAVDQLAKLGRVITGFDSSGKMYLASDHVDMNWNCRATVAAREAWVEWRKSVFGSLGVILLGLYGKTQMGLRRAENRRVAELVQIALDTLRSQELAHHTDPVTAPHPYLSSLQLRDLILQDEHAIPVRRRLWEKVERIVEGNANVRANLEEIPGGDEARVWRWVGSSGLISPRKRD